VYTQTATLLLHTLQLRVLSSPLRMLFSVLLKPWPASIEAHLNIRELLSTILTATETYFNSVLEEFRKRELRSDDSLTEAYRLFGILVQALTRFSALWCMCPLLIAVALLRGYSYRIATSLPLSSKERA